MTRSLNLLNVTDVGHEAVHLLLVLDVYLELGEELRVLPLLGRGLLLRGPVVDVPVGFVEEL
jgi:hypothetical protein